MSWVTFTDPEIASFGLNENQLKDRGIRYEKLEQDFSKDDRAITDNYQYARMILYISKVSIFKKVKLLGGTMEKILLFVKHCTFSTPGTCNFRGVEPVAITIFLAV